jgi:predicted alpha/beta superfamily hydrolase
MIVEELKPFIDLTYRTLDGPRNTAMAGSSLGGIATLCIGLRRPGVFGKLAVLSPSVWWNHGVILRMIRDMPVPEPRPLVWLDIGTAEGDQPNRLVRDARHLRQVLLSRGWTEGGDLAYLEDEGAVHNEIAWRKRMPAILRFLFGRPCRELP